MRSDFSGRLDCVHGAFHTKTKEAAMLAQAVRPFLTNLPLLLCIADNQAFEHLDFAPDNFGALLVPTIACALALAVGIAISWRRVSSVATGSSIDACS